MKKAMIIVLMAAFFSPIPGTAQAQSEAPKITFLDVQPFTYACIPHKGPIAEMAAVIGQLMQAMGGQRLFPPAGPMMGIYYTPPGGDMSGMSWEIGFPVPAQATVLKPLEKKSWTFTTVASALHVGPYDQTSALIPKVISGLMAQGYVPAGPIAERYLDMNPSQVKPADLRTELWVPCRKTK